MNNHVPFEQNKIYLDCNATTPTLPEACEAAICSMRKVYGNPSSPHLVGLEAKTVLERSRKFASDLIHANPQEIFFTSGATEGIQIAVLSFLKDYSLKKETHSNLPTKILISRAEHKAISQAVKHWTSVLKLELSIIEIDVDSGGCVSLEDLKTHIKEAAFVCTMAVNNETGAINNLKEIERIIREQKHPIFWLIDCVQALGKIELNFSSLSVDYAVFSGHKIYAPKGVGFLYVRESAPKCPFIVGGGQEQGLRSGTENLPGVAAIGVVLDILNKIKNNEQHASFRTKKELYEFRSLLVDALKASFPRIVFNNDLEKSVPTTINFSVPGILSTELIRVFDAMNMHVSGGSACNSKNTTYSHVLVAMHLPEWRCANAIRMSFGLATTKEEILNGVQAIHLASNALRKSCVTLSTYTSSTVELNNNSSLHGLLQFNAENSNTWVLYDHFKNSCFIVDPTDENMDRVLNFIECRKVTVDAILDTHSHADHDSSRKLYYEKLHSTNSLSSNWGENKADNALDVLGWPNKTDFLNFNSDVWLVQKIATPGHTLDSISFVVFDKKTYKKDSHPTIAFVGDTILSGGLGRTDFGISGIEQFYHSLNLLNKLFSGNTLICPGHDYDNSLITTWETEKKYNELLKKAVNEFNPMSFQDFSREKQYVDSQIEAATAHGKIVCGLIDVNCVKKNDYPITSYETLSQNNVIAIDVRDDAEFLLFKNWDFINLSVAPMNVPLHRFAAFVSSLLQEKEKYKDKKIVLLCSTGARSLAAARSMRRIGFENVWSVDGGFVFAALKKDESNFLKAS